MDEKKWYILQYLLPAQLSKNSGAAKGIELFNKINNTTLEIFAPVVTQVINRKGKFVKRELPLAYQYVFVRGVFSEIKQLCTTSGKFAFLLNRVGENRYATVTDRQLDSFKIIAHGYGNELPFFALEDIDLEEGDKVEVVEGSFPGLVGTFMPRPRSKSGDLVLAVSQNLGTVVYDIQAKYVRVLEFSATSRRSYDQIDAFVPKLFAGLRSWYSREPISDKIKTEIEVFCRRMDGVKIPNAKLDAKLQVLLLASYIITGKSELAAEANARLTAKIGKVTSAYTLGLIALLESVTTGDAARFIAGKGHITTDADSASKAARQLADEYAFYNPYFS